MVGDVVRTSEKFILAKRDLHLNILYVYIQTLNNIRFKIYAWLNCKTTNIKNLKSPPSFRNIFVTQWQVAIFQHSLEVGKRGLWPILLTYVLLQLYRSCSLYYRIKIILSGLNVHFVFISQTNHHLTIPSQINIFDKII